MANTNKKRNSINDQFAQQMRNNQNTIEILTKLDQSIHSNDSYVTMKSINSSGEEIITQLPTIGYFKAELDRISKSVKILSGIEGNPASVQIANNAFKRIITADLNLEPRKIDNLDPVTVFKTNPNWIFDAFLNPKISIEVDLTDKIDPTIRTIQSRRFIVTFEQILTVQPNGDETLELTAAGQLRLNEFNNLYKGQSNIDIVEFVQWLNQPGLVNRVDDTLIDEDYFKIEPNRLQYQGSFSVLGTEIDTINKKLWYILDTLDYYDVSDPDVTPSTQQLKVGDLVNVNPNEAGITSTTVYKVIELSTVTSDLRVRFEQVYGEEPIPVRLNALNFYSDVIPSRKVRISIGFDEYNVVFLRALDDDNNIQGREWSSGIGFYTNELTLDSNNGESFSEYYTKKVYDYGLVLEDLVQKKVPNYYGIKPNPAVLSNDNFKVVQINQHLTNTVDAEHIRDLHNSKNNLTSEIQQIQEAINNQNRFIATSVFNSQAERKRAEDELAALQSKLNVKTETKFTVVKDILASQKNLNKINPKYRVRGFWPMPEATTSTKTAPQEIVQFEVWYRYLSKSGTENPIATFTGINNSAAQKASDLNTTVNANLSKAKTINAVYSNWSKFKTDSRKRVQDPISGDWLWQIEDVSDADTPNINQLELDINPGEKIEIKIKALSEVGWPETPMESEFSEVLTVEFPDDLNNVLSDDQFILKEASADDIKVQFANDLEARGLNKHLNSSFTIEDIYYAHNPQAISSGFKNDAGKIVNLYDKLLEMINRINTLEEQIKKGKGQLEVYIIIRGVKTKVFNGNSLTFNLNLENYMTITKIGLSNSPVDGIARCYKNDLYVIEDYVLEIKNAAAESPLGLLANRNYAQYPGSLPSNFAYSTNSCQGIWLDNTNNVLFTDLAGSGAGVANSYPKIGTQFNNQWIWLQNKDINGDDIYIDRRHNGTTTIEGINGYNSNTDINAWAMPKVLTTSPTDLISEMALSVQETNKNYGFIGEKSNPNNAGTANTVPVIGVTSATTASFDITDLKHWSWKDNIPDPSTGYTGGTNNLGAIVVPVINNQNDITDISAQKTKIINIGDQNVIQIPLKVYFRPFVGTVIPSYNVSPAITAYDDSQNTTGGGDMPEISTYGTASGKLRINLSTNHDYFKIGDKIVLSNIATTSSIYAYNNIPVNITSINTGSNYIVVNIPVASAPTLGSEVISQVHIWTSTTGKNSQFKQFTVLGNLSGLDTPYVSNYIEFYSSATTPSPAVFNKKLRFYLEDENSARPFEFQFNWQLTHYTKVQAASTTVR